jgi:hypothetical protein
MTRDDIIRWARSAIRLSADDASLMGFDQEKTILDRYEFLCWFASNVATDVRADEREQCAKVCDPYTHGQWFADAIRARRHVQQEPQK